MLFRGFKSQLHCKIHMATFPAFIAGGRPQVPLFALFQTQAGTQVEPPTFQNPKSLAGFEPCGDGRGK